MSCCVNCKRCSKEKGKKKKQKQNRMWVSVAAAAAATVTTPLGAAVRCRRGKNLDDLWQASSKSQRHSRLTALQHLHTHTHKLLHKYTHTHTAGWGRVGGTTGKWAFIYLFWGPGLQPEEEETHAWEFKGCLVCLDSNQRTHTAEPEGQRSGDWNGHHTVVKVGGGQGSGSGSTCGAPAGRRFLHPVPFPVPACVWLDPQCSSCTQLQPIRYER